MTLQMDAHPDAKHAGPAHRESSPDGFSGTLTDRHGMAKLGLKQQTKRYFKAATMAMFGCAIIATGQVIITSADRVVDSVGTGGLFWGFVLVAAVFSVVYTSIAEMTSIYPTAGGQYTWVSMFAPKSCERYLSFETGWLISFGWTSGLVSIASLWTLCMQGLITLHNPAYAPEDWHNTLFIVALLVFAYLFNSCFAKWLPFFEAFVAVVSIGGIFIVCLVFWLLLPRNNPRDAFFQFANNTGWHSVGTAFMISLLYLILALLGFDCAVHMSEETKNASTSTPKAMMTGVAISIGLGFFMVVTLIFTWGNALDVDTDVPFIHLIHVATQNRAATTALALLIATPLLGSVVACCATASRQVWAMARDDGFPCSGFIKRINPRFAIPLWAMGVSFVLCVLLSLVNLGSPEAFNAMLTLNQGAVLGSYILAIGCKINARVRGNLPSSPWSLGRCGLYVDILALLLLAPLFVFAMFPGSPSVSADNMNWGVLMFGSVVLLSTIYFFLRGTHHYVSPRQRKDRVEDAVAL